MNHRPRRRIQSLAAKVALAVLAPVVFLALAEGALRLFRVGFPARFLQPATIAGTPCWVNNPFYGYRFFPPEMARNPPPLACARKKDPGVVRVVILGESAAMGDPLIEFGAPRMLGKMLNHAGGTPRFEVVNAAMTAINSPVIADIAADLRRLRPDVVIIYMGNNEVVGPFGPSASTGGRLAARLVPLRVALTRWRLLLGLKYVGDSLAAAGRNPRFFQMDALGKLELRADDPRLESVYPLYENRLARIIALARDAGAEVLLTTLAVNLADSPPFGSAWRADLSAADRSRWEQAYAEGIRAQTDGRTADAVAAFQSAAHLDPGHAELAFRLAQTLADDGQADAARLWFSRARDADTRRFRADSRINQIIRDTARRQPVRLVDAETACAETADDAALFLDHVHFTFAGTYRLAGLWFDEIAKDYPELDKPSAAICRERLLFTPWGEHRQAQAMATRFARPPFTQQFDNARRQAAWTTTIQNCARTIAATDFSRVRPAYEREIARDPRDPFLPFQWGSILLKSNRLTEALPPLTDYMERLPHHFEARLMPAFILAKSSQPEKAAEALLGLGPPYGHYLFENAIGLMDSLRTDGFRREARAFGQAVLDRRRFFPGRRHLADRVAEL